MRILRALGCIEIEDPVQAGPGLRQRTRRGQQDLAQRIVRVEESELGGGRVVAQRVARVERMGEVALRHRADLRAGRIIVVGRVRQHRGFGPRDRVVTRSAVDRVVAQPAIDDVVGVFRTEQHILRRRVRVHIVRRQVSGVGERTVDVDYRVYLVIRILDQQADLRHRDRRDAVERLAEGRAVAAAEDQPVVAEDAVVPGAARDPVGAVAADDAVVLAVAEQHVVADHAEEEVIAGLAVDLVGGADVGRRNGGLKVGAARRVVEHLRGAHYDLRRGIVVVVVEAEVMAGRGAVGADDAIDVAVVAQDHVGVFGMALRRGVA